MRRRVGRGAWHISPHAVPVALSSQMGAGRAGRKASSPGTSAPARSAAAALLRPPAACAILAVCTYIHLRILSPVLPR